MWMGRGRLWILGLLLALPGLAWAAAGTVQVVLGQARIIQSTGQERAAIKGDQVYTGDTITTGASGQVQLRMIDDARMWVRPNSRLLIEQYPADAAAAQEPRAQTATRLIEGGLRAATGAIGQRSPDKVRLSTPNAVIGIRGTELELVFFPDRLAEALQTPAGTYHRVYEGRTRLTTPGSVALDVLAGQAVFVSLKPGEAPRVLPQIPPFLNLPDGPVGNPPAREATQAAAARSLKIGLRMASPTADGAVVVSSAGAPVEPVQTSAMAREGEPARLSLSYAPPPNSRQRRAPEPPVTLTLDISVKLQDGQAQVQVQDALRGGSLSLTMPLGTWTDISGRASWLSGGRQTIASSSARAESAQVLIRVDAGP
ncbi:MAG: hypothetical protein EBV28_09990 [Betaproteobacteria bacterium]|nr:hypothetical protein [Betaproteobacteria bacterium]